MRSSWLVPGAAPRLGSLSPKPTVQRPLHPLVWWAAVKGRRKLAVWGCWALDFPAEPFPAHVPMEAVSLLHPLSLCRTLRHPCETVSRSIISHYQELHSQNFSTEAVSFYLIFIRDKRREESTWRPPSPIGGLSLEELVISPQSLCTALGHSAGKLPVCYAAHFSQTLKSTPAALVCSLAVTLADLNTCATVLSRPLWERQWSCFCYRQEKEVK